MMTGVTREATAQEGLHFSPCKAAGHPLRMDPTKGAGEFTTGYSPSLRRTRRTRCEPTCAAEAA